MAGRRVEGLIVKRPWEGESHCSGCKATAQEMSEEAGWEEKKVRTNTEIEDRELLVRQITQIHDREDTKKSQTLLFSAYAPASEQFSKSCGRYED